MATFASHGYTGVMKTEREVGVGLWVRPRGVIRYGRRSKRRLSTARRRNGPDAAKVRSRWSILVRVFGHLCAAFVKRGAFFGRKMRAVFGRVKTSISKGLCKTMSHPRTVPSAASDARKSGFAHGRACGDRARPRCATGNDGSGDAKEAQSPGRCKKARGVTRFGRPRCATGCVPTTSRKRNRPDAAKKPAG